MGSACLETLGTLDLCHAALETQAAHHGPESTRDLFRVGLQVVRHGEGCVTDAKRSPASLTGRGEAAELHETACRAADGIKAGIRIQGSAPLACAARLLSRRSDRRSRRQGRHINAQEAAEGWVLRDVGRAEGKGLLGRRSAAEPQPAECRRYFELAVRACSVHLRGRLAGRGSTKN